MITQSGTEEVPDVGGVADVEPASVTPVHHRLRRRVLTYALALFLLVNLNFLLPRALPGDPIEALFSSSSPSYVRDDATREELTRYYRLDGTLLDQYTRYLRSLAGGDLGVSIRQNAPVTDLLAARLGWTALLVLSSLGLAAVVGMAAGVHSAWHRGGAVDRRLLASLIGMSSVPPYLLATLALILFAVKLRWLPLSGGRTPFAGSLGPLAQLADIAAHLALPALVMATSFVFSQYLVMRGSMVSELGSDYLRAGEAKGLPPRRLQFRYAARNALLPVVTVQGLQLRAAVGTSIFVEQVFAYPGLGLLLVSAVGSRDYPLMQGAFLFLSVLVLTANLAVDCLYQRLDPRTAP